PARTLCVLRHVPGRGALWCAKHHAAAPRLQPGQERKYKPIEMPNNSPTGFINAFFAVVIGFALIWHIWWLAGLGILGAFATVLAFAFRDKEEVEISAGHIAQFDRAHPVEFAL